MSSKHGPGANRPGVSDEFRSLIQFFIQDRNSKLASQIPDRFLSAELYLGFRSDPIHERVGVTIPASAVFDPTKPGSMTILRPMNTPFPLGSRPDYNVVLAFESKEVGEPFEELLAIEGFDKVSLENILDACIRSDMGFLLMGSHRMMIIEPDRVNEYVRASLPDKHFTPSADEISDVGPHRLRPEEYDRLLELLDTKSDWIETVTIASAKVGGSFANVLYIKAKPGIDLERFNSECDTLSRQACEIKTPFLVMGSISRDAPGRGGFGD